MSPEETLALERSSASFDRTVLDPIIAEFKSQGDRAAVIVAAAQLDDQLRTLLERFLLPDRKAARTGDADSLLARDRPLGSFSSRIVAAQRCGLVDGELARSLDIIRDMRNAFAHLTTPADLNASPQRERVAQLCRPIPSPTFWASFIAEFGADTPANRFRAVVAVYMMILLGDVANVRPVSAQPLLGANNVHR